MTETGRDSSGRFITGNKLGPGRGDKEARVRGEIREKLLNAINVNMNRFNEVYSMLDPNQKIQALIGLMKYAIPTQQGHDGTTNQLININIQAPDLENKELNLLLNDSTTDNSGAGGQAQIDTEAKSV